MSITATNIIAIIHGTEVSLVITNKQRPTKNNEPVNIISVLLFVSPKTVMHVKGIAKAPKIMPIKVELVPEKKHNDDLQGTSSAPKYVIENSNIGTIIGTVSDFSAKTNKNATKIYISDCFAEQ